MTAEIIPSGPGSNYLGLLLLVLGGILAIWRRKRKFDRTNAFGVEQFSSYLGKLRSKMRDGLLGGSSLVLGSAGILILAVHYQDSWGWVVLLPAYAFMVFLMFGL